jgi:uncharacterized protein involved in copper resistance
VYPPAALQLLVDHIRCQEEVEQILQLQEQLLTQLQAAPDPEAAVQAALGRSVADQLPGSNWSTSIAASVTVGHIMAVRGMTMQVCVGMKEGSPREGTTAAAEQSRRTGRRAGRQILWHVPDNPTHPAAPVVCC